MAGLLGLPPRQRAALVLCDVLGFPVAEAAGMLGTSGAAVKGALQRARATLEERRPAAARRGAHGRARPPSGSSPGASPTPSRPTTSTGWSGC